ncbi:hypothetical protein EYF80_020770 [Liparis tanakae]|uniref:Uncharacterized protein n=1 Tax=Liparis tanakae TaxID=230148 RepID=A0A4Z2HTR0_9TELE|nr:hypothetical protein EYF80_020770 [Liparis tanakae]
MDVDGCGWTWMDVDGCGWMWMDVDGCGWMWMDVDGCGWMWMDVDGRGWMWMDVLISQIGLWAPSDTTEAGTPRGPWAGQEETRLCLWLPARPFCLSYLKETIRKTSKVTPWIPARRKK